MTLAVTILDARPSPSTAAPAITFRLRIEHLSGRRVHAMVLRCQTRIEPRGRRYSREEQARLFELFGDRSQWERTLQTVTWAHSTIAVPAFAGRIDVDMPVACTYDLEVASAKYLHAIRDGDVPLSFVFSGTVFLIADGTLSIEPIPWTCEAVYRLHSQVWVGAMTQFFPGGGWLRLHRDTIDRLQEFRGRNALVGWDDVMARLLEAVGPQECA